MENIIEKIYLTELFDVETIQRMQNSFAATLGISMGIFDENGVEMTERTSRCAFCFHYTRGSQEGLKRCSLCENEAVERIKKNKKVEFYTCHAGMQNFAMPIIVEEQYIGYILCGQILHEPMSKEKIRAYAQELGIRPEEYEEAAKNIMMISEERWKNITDFLYDVINLLFQMAYKRQQTLQTSHLIEQEAHMKSDFLANMSHEIRTPMNAVIGMAEMALREELPLMAREYIRQIMIAGNTLLTIINDILDFSKITSGKMDINLAEYEPFSLIQDIVNVIMTRIGDKKLELIVDVAPDIPRQLMGDSNRIKQIIINLANNAVKFTREGYVHLSIDYEKRSEREIMLKVFVEDTGIGIKAKDMEKLFHSFQQLDSKRNRNVEGTGLGLAISKQLLTLMNGTIRVESEYEKGSRFSFELPQLVIDDGPSIEEERFAGKTVGIVCNNPHIRLHMKKMLEQLHIPYLEVEKREDLQHFEENDDEAFLFIELADDSYASILNDYMVSHPAITGVWITNFGEQIKAWQENVVMVPKPFYIMTLAKIMNHESIFKENDDLEENFEFIAPEAEILVVDDNDLNLMVVSGILAPLQMKIDKATSGKEALEMIAKKRYDLVFMDHMMPEMDGIEVTQKIRSLHREYDSVPIIALTANVMEETRSMFLVEGMNDFVAKPIELKIILSKLQQWLPADKIQKVDEPGEQEDQKRERLMCLAEEINIPILDVSTALMLAGSEELFWQILKEFVKTIPKKANLIRQHLEEKNWKKYTIEAHALKSFSKQVGALELSELAAKMERAGNDNDIHFILAHHEEMLEKYQAYETELKQYIGETPGEGKPKEKDGYDAGAVSELLERMQEAIDNLDIDAMDGVVEKLDGIMLPNDQGACFARIKDTVEELDVEGCESILSEWRKMM